MYFLYSQITHSHLLFLPLITIHFSKALEYNRLIQKIKHSLKEIYVLGNRYSCKNNLNLFKTGCFLLLKHLLLREAVKKLSLFGFYRFGESTFNQTKLLTKSLLTSRSEVIICKNNLKENSLFCRLH
jgi:hypothetical protein